MNNLFNSVKRMENHAFDNFDTFDPDMFDPTLDSYDPSGATDSSYYDEDMEGYDLADEYGKPMKRLASKRMIKQQPLAQLDVVIDNSAISNTTTVELFNVLRSNTLIQNTTYNTTSFAPNTFDNLFLRNTPATGQALSDAQLIYWDKLGNLIYNTTTGAAAAMGTAFCKISCPQVPFRVLHEATRNNLLYIEKVRLSVKTAAQIDQPFNLFKNTFMGGTKSNQIAPRSEFKPNQFQSLIVDVPFKTSIDAETGLSYTLISQEKVTISIFFRFIRGNEHMKGGF
jgi:hypothetical protein